MCNINVIKLTRDSVCMGDDVAAPNEIDIRYNSEMTLSQLLEEIAKGIPFMFEEQHTIWGIENEGHLIACIESDVSGKMLKHLMIGDILIKELRSQEIYCRYFYEYKGDLCGKLRLVAGNKFKQDHSEQPSLLEYVKA